MRAGTRGVGKAVHERVSYFKHESAFVDEAAVVGEGTRIWHFSHVQPGARLGRGCVLGQNVNIGNDVVIGDFVRIQNNVSVYTGTIVEDYVFLGPSCVLTNVTNPRSEICRQALYETTLIMRGATIGANATVVCGVTLGRYCFVAAGAVITRSAPDYALMIGSPARQRGWMSRHGHVLKPDVDGLLRCPESGYRYEERSAGVLRCLDLDENEPLPAECSIGSTPYRDFQSRGR